MRHATPFLLAAFLTAGLGAPRAARAEDPPADSVRETTWYGWQLLVADGIALGLWGPGAFRLATDPNFANHEFGGVLAAGLFTGVLLSTLGTPLIHVPHHHRGRAIGSMAARILLPLATVALTGFSGFGCDDSDPRCHDEAGMNSARWTFGVLLAVEAIDALNASDERFVVAALPGRRGVALAWRF
jgi:hypothetical protein